MVYIIELDKPLGGPVHFARYYCGYCRGEGIKARLARHQSGHGSKMLAAAAARGIGMKVVFLLRDGTRADERRIKARKNLGAFVRSKLGGG